MENLYDLISQFGKSRALIEAQIPQSEDSPLLKLYNILVSGARLDDDECMQEIYGKRNITAFSRLKSRLSDIIVSALSLQSVHNEIEDARLNEAIDGFTKTQAARVLNARKSSKLAAELLEKAIVKSIKYHVTENILAQSRMLIGHYSTTVLNKYKVKKYSKIYEKYRRIYDWEVKAEGYYHELQNLQLQSLANLGDEVIKKAERYSKELQSVKDVKGYIFNINRYRVTSAFYEFKRDYNALLDECEKAEKEFSAPDLKTIGVLTSIKIRKAWALIQAGRYQECAKQSYDWLPRIVSGSYTWYVLSYYTLKAFIYNKSYSKALQLINQMFSHSRFSKLSDNHTELFFTYLGYVHLILDAGLAGNNIADKKKLPDFKLGKFLNTTPVFSKDKRGINISIILLHIAYLLKRKNYNAIIDRVDSLNQYAYRYLRKDDTFRSNCMIKMVIQMTKADFNPIRTERYTADLREQLSSVSLIGSGENIEIEMIPFEVLWDIMMKSLED